MNATMLKLAVHVNVQLELEKHVHRADLDPPERCTYPIRDGRAPCCHVQLEVDPAALEKDDEQLAMLFGTSVGRYLARAFEEEPSVMRQLRAARAAYREAQP